MLIYPAVCYVQSVLELVVFADCDVSETLCATRNTSDGRRINYFSHADHVGPKEK
jgi:hypothetical protein